MNDKKLDELIKASLTTEEAAYYDQLEEQDLFQKMTLIYKGKLRWISVLQTIAMAALAIFGLYAAIRFYSVAEVTDYDSGIINNYGRIQYYNAVEVTSMLRWGFAALLSLIASSLVKLFLIQLMTEKSIMRELKRLELQMAHLVSNTTNENTEANI